MQPLRKFLILSSSWALAACGGSGSKAGAGADTLGSAAGNVADSSRPGQPVPAPQAPIRVMTVAEALHGHHADTILPPGAKSFTDSAIAIQQATQPKSRTRADSITLVAWFGIPL
jgi:hypothetical protein